MERFLEYLDAERGRRQALARELGISPSAVSMWTRVPTDRVLEVERLTGISRHVLRPDIFGLARGEEAGTADRDAGTRGVEAGQEARRAERPTGTKETAGRDETSETAS